ncbi:MAG: hypothetical protein ACAI35_02125, partial [Candidatus Methylacidiphilales bacterium]
DCKIYFEEFLVIRCASPCGSIFSIDTIKTSSPSWLRGKTALSLRCRRGAAEGVHENKCMT